MSDANDTNAPAPVVPAATAADSQPQYEFTPTQNRIIDDLAMAIVWVRLPLLVAGLFQAMIAAGLAFRIGQDGAHIVGVLGHGMAAVICFMLANWLMRAATAFTLITTTKGRDISHLMSALLQLDAWFDMLAFFVKMYLILLGILMLLLLVGLIGGAFKGPV